MTLGSTTRNPNNPSKSKRLMSLGVVFIATVIIFASLGTAHAGLVSFLSYVMGNEQVFAKTDDATRVSDPQISRSIVLQAPSNPNSLAISSAIPPIVYNTTLSPDIARMNATTSEPQNTQISIYVVRPGDTISGVAKMFDVSVNTVLWANDLTSRSVLKVDQTLVILPVTGITYKIRSGDTIQGIAKRYGADVNDIMNYNDITLASKLQVGEEIIIPDAEDTTPVVKVVKSGVRSVPFSPILDGPGWPSYPGYFLCPVMGSRLSQGLHGHNGVDLALVDGTPIRAAASGTVIINRSNGAWNGGYGNFVVILHPNGTQTLYSHMSRSAVSAGESVSQGQTVGYIGMTGLTTGPHLHFEIRGAKNPFGDPMACR